MRELLYFCVFLVVVALIGALSLLGTLRQTRCVKPQAPEEITHLWLEYQYGWTPMDFFAESTHAIPKADQLQGSGKALTS